MPARCCGVRVSSPSDRRIRMRTCQTVGKTEFDFACSADHKEQLIHYAPEAFSSYTALCVKSKEATPAGVTALLQAKTLHPIVAKKVRSNMLLEAEEEAMVIGESILQSIRLDEKAVKSRKRRLERGLAEMKDDDSSEEEDEEEDAEISRLKAFKLD